MAKTYNGRFSVPKAPSAGTGWLVLGVALMLFGSFPGIVLGLLSLGKYDKCKKERKLYERFFHYCAVIGMRQRISVRELAKIGDRGKDNVRKDLQKMIAKGYFGEYATLDMSTDELVPSDGYSKHSAPSANWKDAVVELMHALHSDFGVEETVSQPAQESAEPAAETEKSRPAPAQEAKTAYMDGLERTLNELYQLNVQIRDEEVSRRIDRIGELTGGIFHAVIENPARESDVRKFMNYYLPTTLKLLKSYDLLEKQSYQGENIQASRRKIENVLDMLIEAYEKQLDKLFTNDALDIATDIDVLETMMAGDGLSSKGQMRI